MRFSRTEPVERCSEAYQRVLRRDSLLVLHRILPGNCREVPLEELRPVSLPLVFRSPIVVGIGDDVKGFCTQYIQIMGYRGQYGALLYRIP